MKSLEARTNAQRAATTIAVSCDADSNHGVREHVSLQDMSFLYKVVQGGGGEADEVNSTYTRQSAI